MIVPRVDMKVRIVREIKDWPLGFTATMCEAVGKSKVWTISKVETRRDTVVYVRLKEDWDAYVWPPECMEEACPPLKLTGKVRLRNGNPVRVKKLRVKDRPFQAEVVIANHELTLTYCADGRFYPDFDSPIDLVNT